MGSGRAKTFYCRQHEGHHLTSSPEVEAINLQRLAALITPQDGCWVAEGPKLGCGDHVGFTPEGANKVAWLFHRVVWGILLGGHEPGKELDHLCPRKERGVGAACCNPSHLQPVTHAENMRRKHDPRRGPRINWEAATNPRVIDFAARHGLPLPVRAPSTGRERVDLSA